MKTRTIIVTVSFPWGSSPENDECSEVEIPLDYTGDLIEHPDVLEECERIMWERVGVAAEEK